MPRGERCWGAVCGRTARTVRQGAAGEAVVQGDTEQAPGGKPVGLSPCDLRTNDQPAAYLTGARTALVQQSSDASPLSFESACHRQQAELSLSRLGC